MAGFWKIIEGAGMIAAGIGLDVFAGGAGGVGNMLIAAGAGQVISGVGTMIQGDPLKGFATTTRNPIAPWRVAYGRVRTGGTLVYMHTWGDNDQMLDMVVVLAAHQCQSVDFLLLDQQLVQIDTAAIPTSAAAGYSIPTPAANSGTSFTPVQQKVAIGEIKRVGSVVTVSLNANIPALLVGSQVLIESVPGDPTLNGTFQVAQIVSQTWGSPGSITFTYLCGGQAADVLNAGYVHTLYPDYGRNIYVEYLLGNQTLGQTFVGMTAGTPWQGTGKLCTPASPQNAGGGQLGPGPNPWTNYCSLQGKTAAFIRIRYDEKYFPSGLPQISFLLHGKNDIYDPRLGALTGIGTAGLGASGTGYQQGDILTVGGGTGGQITVNVVGGTGAITAFQVTAVGSGYSVASGLALTGGHGSGATLTIQTLTGATGTIGYTENAALCVADFLANQKWGYKAIYGTDIPTSPLTTAANVCDQTVTLSAGGTEPRYTCNGQFELSLRRGEILQNLLTSCAGRLIQFSGTYQVQPGYWAGLGSPAAAADLMAIASGPFRWSPAPSIRDHFNAVKGTYISPENKWQSADFPYYAQDAMHGYSGPAQYAGDINLASDNGERRWLELHLPFTISHSMAQRIAKIELLRRRFGGTGTFALTLAGYQFAPLDLFSATHAFLGWSGKYLEVQNTRFRMDEKGGAYALGTEIDVQETDTSIYQWTASEELSPQGYVQSKYPTGAVVPTVCWPWSPGYAAPLSGDAIYTQGGGSPWTSWAPASFGVQPDYSRVDSAGNPVVAVQIKGTPPINALDTGVSNPQISCTGSTTGGFLPAGDYVVGLSAFDSGAASEANTDYLNLSTVTIPATSPATSTGSISVTATWGSGDDGGDLYVAPWNSLGQYVFHKNQTLAPGAASATITGFPQGTHGGPDPIFDHFGVAWQEEIHGGVWAQQVQSVTSTTVTIAGGGMTLNQWAGYTLSLLAKYDQTLEVGIINMPVASNTASSGSPAMFTLTIGTNSVGAQLPDLTTLLAVGDLVLMRYKATFTASGFSDLNIANPYYTGGATGAEAGNVAVVLTGADAGDVQTVASVSTDVNGNYTIYNLAGSWKIQPANGDLVAICAPSSAPEWESTPIQSKNGSLTMALNPVIPNLAGKTWLFRVRTKDVNDVSGDDAVAPVREMYVFGAQGTRTVTN